MAAACELLLRFSLVGQPSAAVNVTLNRQGTTANVTLRVCDFFEFAAFLSS
jgi:hypothetical protein